MPGFFRTGLGLRPCIAEDQGRAKRRQIQRPEDLDYAGPYADMIFCLCRTDLTTKKQAGITLILTDMKSKGVTVRPIQIIDCDHEVS